MIKAIIFTLIAFTTTALCSDYTPFTDGMNWAAVSNMNQMVTVANEIVIVTQASTADTNELSEVGENAGATPFIDPTDRWTVEMFQELIEVKYDELWFGDDEIDGATNYYVKDAYGFPEGLGVYQRYYTISNFYDSVGINWRGFRRAETNWPTNWENIDDAAYTYGGVETGDIIGPWVFDDIQKCFSGMTTMVQVVGWGFDPTISNRWYGSSAGGTNWGETVSDAYGDYGAVQAVSTRPRAHTEGTHNYLNPPPNTNNFNLKILLYFNKAKLTAYGKDIERDVSFYARGDKPAFTPGNVVYDDNGSGVIEGEWGEISSASFTPTNQVQDVHSSQLGSSSAPAVCDEPLEDREVKGWDIRSSTAPGTGNDYKPVAVSHFTWSYMR